ncbi:unnamed protein product [Ilex paraguariensis]|uniref:Uncharacterized protein n=1 Tax=Ilex paraguariensis TaxID=185542 RepID=A0ABC8SP03_9AQUA
MPDIQEIVNEFVKGSQATARLTAELLRSVISIHKLPPTNQAAALIEAVRGIGEKLIAANPNLHTSYNRSNTCQTDGSAELAIGNIVRRVLYIIREEELSLLTSDTEELNFPAVSGVDEIIDQDYNSVTSAAAIASRNFLRSPSLRTLLEKMPNSAAACQTSSGGDSGEKCKCKLFVYVIGNS